MRIYGSILLLVALAMPTQLLAQTQSATGKPKEVKRSSGTTGAVGSRCVGGTYNSCYSAMIKTGWKASSAASHCATTCK